MERLVYVTNIMFKKNIIALIIIITVLTTTANVANTELYLGKMENKACAIFSIVNCINNFGLEQVELSDAIDIAPSFGWEPNKGLTPDGARDLAKALVPEGIKTFGKYFSVSSVEEYLDKGCTMLIGVDAHVIWKGVEFRAENHAIAVLGKEVNENGVSFVIVDPGKGMYMITREQLEACTADIFQGVYFRLEEC